MSDESSFTVEVHGLEELQAALEELGGPTANKILRSGLGAGAKVIVDGVTGSAGSIGGELGSAFQDTKNWSKSTRIVGEFAGIARVKPKGALPELHTGEGSPKFTFQPKGKRYHRSLNYLLKLLEVGASGGTYRGLRFPLLTGSFESGKDNVVAAMIQKIRERLGLE